jgi:hypothetical protein
MQEGTMNKNIDTISPIVLIRDNISATLVNRRARPLVMTSLPASLIVHTNDDSKHIAGMNTGWVAPERESEQQKAGEKRI